jgi:hypothetical protein
MKRQINFYIFFLIFFLQLEAKRSPFRKIDPETPVITAFYQKNPELKYQYSDWNYYRSPLFTTFFEEHFFAHIIDNAYQEITISENDLNDMLETLVEEVKNKKSSFTHFTILKDKNFNHRKQCGLLVVKFKNYPFVVKLFMETPETIGNYTCKGLETRVFHIMGHGSSRHIAGLTRIPNLLILQKRITALPYHVILPKKWFWLPADPSWITIIGKNIDPDTIIATTIPGTYVVLAEELHPDSKKETVSPSVHNRVAMNFCNQMELIVDPHENNFVIQRDAITQEVYLSLVDTEHFPTLVGITTKYFNNHISWYCSLAKKAVCDMFFTSKQYHVKNKNR